MTERGLFDEIEKAMPARRSLGRRSADTPVRSDKDLSSERAGGFSPRESATTLPHGDEHWVRREHKAIANAAKVTKRYVDAATDPIADELREALKG